MNITTKYKRGIGTTTRLVKEAYTNNGLYIAPTTGTFSHAQEIVRKYVICPSFERIRTMKSFMLNLPKDKSIPLYFDEGCNIDEIIQVDKLGYNVAEAVKGDYNFEKEFYNFINKPLNISTNTKKSSELEVKKVIYDIPNNTTIVYFEDGTKEIARVMDGDTFDKEVGVMQCIVKKMYGNRSKWLKDIVNKGIEVKSKKVKGE